jgi:tetratricopeptide (TPR) repeat protein
MALTQARISPTVFQVFWGSAILLLVLVVYAPIYSAGFIWDDPDYIINNQTLRSPRGLARIWVEPKASPQYYPLVFTTFWIEHQCWGLSPAGYHIDNVLLHGLGSVLFWRVLLRLGVPGAWLAAALFALHPVQVESVAWITERKNVLSSVLYWGALLAYLHFDGIGGPASRRPWLWYALSLFLFVCALLSKSVTCTLPAVLVLLLWWKQSQAGERPPASAGERQDGGAMNRRNWRCLAPMFVLGIALGLNTAYLEVAHVGAIGDEYSLRPIERVLLAGRALCFYADELVWPLDLTFIYPRWHVDASQGWQYLFPLAALCAGVVLWGLRSRFGLAPFVAYLCFAGTLFPALGFFNIYPFRYSFVADHFQYLACAAPLAAIAAGGALATRRLGKDIGAVLVALLLVPLGLLSWAQVHVYQDIDTLWQDTLKKNPSCWLAWNNLGSLSLGARQYAEAESHFRQCLALKPDHFRARRGLVQALLGQGRVIEANNELASALHMLEEQVATISKLNRPGMAAEFADFGTLYEGMGDDDEALRLYRAGLEVWPDDPLNHFRLGLVLAQQSEFAEAAVHLRFAAHAQPDSAEAHFYLAQALAADGQRGAALTAAREALRLAELQENPALASLVRQQFAELPSK